MYLLTLRPCLYQSAATFGQLDTVVNTLMGAIQECHAASHNCFEIADAKLAQNLHFHNRVRDYKLNGMHGLLSGTKVISDTLTG